MNATAPGKVILFGEHAVVFGRPAIAVPVTQVRATAEVMANASSFQIQALDLGSAYQLADAPADDPLAAAVWTTLEHLGRQPPAVTLSIQSTIPIASGLGSGAAVSVAIIRALARYLGTDLTDAAVSNLTFEVEKLHHGTPSGIDNTVLAFCRPLYFVRGQPIQTFTIHTPFRLLIADTGIASPTKTTVGEVRAAWQTRPARYEALFDQIGQVAKAARFSIENGQVDKLGPLMTRNQGLLEQLNVSSPQLEALIGAALATGADGAKLSGAGRGGNLIVLVRPEREMAITQALEQVGAVNVIAAWVR